MRYSGWGLVLLLALATPAWSATRCMSYEEKTLRRLQALCDDGTRATSYWNWTLERWESTITPPPGKACTGGLNPRTRHWEVRCR
jgi:hypothetical protein